MKYRAGKIDAYIDVTVCDKWQTFEGFLEDMGERPAGMTLDRIDPFKGYYKENCRWATPKVQGKNKRKNHAKTT